MRKVFSFRFSVFPLRRGFQLRRGFVGRVVGQVNSLLAPGGRGHNRKRETENRKPKIGTPQGVPSCHRIVTIESLPGYRFLITGKSSTL
jgi:hypothetical protein